jgi:hypothetical protein
MAIKPKQQEALATVPPELVGLTEIDTLIQAAQNAKPGLEELVQLRVKESQTITVIKDDAGMLVANAQLERIVELRNNLKASDVTKAADILHKAHRILTGWRNGWDKLLETRETSLKRALVAYQQAKEEAAARERERLRRIAEEEARQKQEKLRLEAERKRKEELAELEQTRQNVLGQLCMSFRFSGGQQAAAECEQLAKRRSDNANQVRQDIEAAQQALDSLGKGNLSEATSIMRFTQEAPPPPPPPPPQVEVVAPAAVYVPEPEPLPSAVKGTRPEPHFAMLCEHDAANGETCANCQQIPRKFLKLDESGVKAHLKKMGEGLGGTVDQPNTTAVPGIKVWWTREATLNRSGL